MTIPPQPGQTLAGVLLALAAYAVFALHDALIKFLGGQYPSVQLVFLAALAGIGPVLVLMRRRGGLRMPRGQARALLRLRSTIVVLATLTGFHAFSTLPLAQTYAILFATPLLIGLLAVPMLGERLEPARLGAILLGLLGVLIVLRPGQETLQAGHLSALFCAFGGAMIAVLTRKIGGQAPLGLVLIQPMAANLLLMGAALPFVYQPMPLADLGLAVVLGLCAALAMALSIIALHKAPAAVIAPLQYSQAVWALIYGQMLFDERVDTTTLLGASIVIASGAFIILREAARRPATRPGPAPPSLGPT